MVSESWWNWELGNTERLSITHCLSVTHCCDAMRLRCDMRCDMRCECWEAPTVCSGADRLLGSTLERVDGVRKRKGVTKQLLTGVGRLFMCLVL